MSSRTSKYMIGRWTRHRDPKRMMKNTTKPQFSSDWLDGEGLFGCHRLWTPYRPLEELHASLFHLSITNRQSCIRVGRRDRAMGSQGGLQKGLRKEAGFRGPADYVKVTERTGLTSRRESRKKQPTAITSVLSWHTHKHTHAHTHTHTHTHTHYIKEQNKCRCVLMHETLQTINNT